MNKHLKQVVAIMGSALACVVFAWMLSISARADVGVRPILPGGSSLKPEEVTPIEMAAETVVFNVRSATPADNATLQLNPQAYGLDPSYAWFPAVAEVQADFTMKNPTNETVSMTAWFPLASALGNLGWELNPDEIVPRIQSFQVSVGGDPVDYAVSELPNPQGGDKPPLPWASFPVSFPAGKETMIHVSYLLPLQPSVKGSELALYYIFQTGAGWAGPIGQAELVLNLPYPASPETLAGTPPSSMSLPYGTPKALPGLPAGSQLEGNQARWTWKDLEPRPQDDFAVWLVSLDKYQALDSARAVVQANPQDGQAWLDLASIYHSLSITGYNNPSIFSSSYLSSGVEAYQKAAELLPEHPAPHAGLALLSLAPYMADKNAPAEVVQYVQDELNIARELESRYPSLAEGGGISSGIVEDVLKTYFYNDATATIEAATWAVEEEALNAAATADAATEQNPSSTPNIPTLTPVPSTTPQPLPSAPPTASVSQPGTMTGNLQLPVMIAVTGIFVLIIVIYLVLKRMRGV
jgi:hypothetical protein